MFESIDTSTALSLITLFATMAMQLIGFGKIIGSVNVKLSSYDEQHIRHQTRIDEQTRLINNHQIDLAILKDRKERGEE